MPVRQASMSRIMPPSRCRAVTYLGTAPVSEPPGGWVYDAFPAPDAETVVPPIRVRPPFNALGGLPHRDRPSRPRSRAQSCPRRYLHLRRCSFPSNRRRRRHAAQPSGRTFTGPTDRHRSCGHAGSQCHHDHAHQELDARQPRDHRPWPHRNGGGGAREPQLPAPDCHPDP